ncbi:hypothetical protein CRYUN_Cryun18bG0004100 [Craigia yunnanensis]
MEKSSHLNLCKLQPPVKYDQLKSGQRKTDVGIENSKTDNRKTDGDHMGHICLCFPAGWGGRICSYIGERELGSKPPRGVF